MFGDSGAAGAGRLQWGSVYRGATARAPLWSRRRGARTGLCLGRGILGLARRSLGVGARNVDASAEAGRSMGARPLGPEWASLPFHPRALAAVGERSLANSDKKRRYYEGATRRHGGSVSGT